MDVKIIVSMKTRFVVALIGMLIIAGCDEINELLTFTIEDESSFVVESTVPLSFPIDLATPDVTTNSNQKFENNNTKASLVKDVRLKELTLSISTPTDKTFSFLKSVRLFISTDQQPEIELASAENILADVDVIALTPTSEKLDAYVKSSTYKLRTQIVTRETLTEDVEIGISLAFKVTADPL
jgi:hypothetical protein